MADATGTLPSRRASGAAPVVILVAQPRLLAQAVEVALRSRGLDVTMALGEGAAASTKPPDVLLLVNDLARPEEVRRARASIARSGCPVLVLTSREPDLAWGALLDAGAADVLPATTGLDDLEAAIRRGGSPRSEAVPRKRTRLVRQWQRAAHERLEVVADPTRGSEADHTVPT